MTNESMDIDSLLKLLDQSWLEDEYTIIIKQAIRDSVKLMPKMMILMEKIVDHNIEDLVL